MSSDKRANQIILALYLFFILISQILASPGLCTSYLLIGAIVLIAFSFVISPVIIRFVSRFSLHEEQHFTKISGKKLKILFYGLPLLVLLLYYFAYYPGGYINDSLAQYNEYFYGQYGDWHPALHTLLVFTLPLKLTRGWIGSVVLFQIIFFAAALGYGFETVHEYAGRNYVIGCMVYILCNPLLAISVNPWKDTSFAIGALLLMTYSLKIVCTKGQWLKKPLNMIIFVFVFVFTTIFRHNAVLFTVPLLFAVFFYVSRKRFICLLIAAVALFGAAAGASASPRALAMLPKNQRCPVSGSISLYL